MTEASPGPEQRANDDARPDAVDEIQRAWVRERPGTPPGSIGIITRIWRVSKLLSDDRRRTLARLGIDAATLDLLATLRRSGEPYRLTAGEIADRTLVTAGAVSQRVARAERAGLVRRNRSPADGRLSFVTLTSQGHALVDRVVDGLLAHEDMLLTALNPQQRDTLSELLRTLLASLPTLSAATVTPGASSLDE